MNEDRQRNMHNEGSNTASIGRFISGFEPLPGEKVVWEGKSSKRAGAAGFLAMGALIALLAAIFLPLCTAIRYAEAAERRAAITRLHEKVRAGEASQAEAEYLESQSDVPYPSTILGGVVAIFAGFIVIFGSIDTILRYRRSYYVVTSERVCIQSGAVNVTIATIDLDKIVSIKSYHGLFQRFLGLHSIEVVHSGWSQIQRSGFPPISNPFSLANIPVSEKIYSKLANEWLPRDNPEAGSC